MSLLPEPVPPADDFFTSDYVRLSCTACEQFKLRLKRIEQFNRGDRKDFGDFGFYAERQPDPLRGQGYALRLVLVCEGKECQALIYLTFAAFGPKQDDTAFFVTNGVLAGIPHELNHP